MYSASSCGVTFINIYCLHTCKISIRVFISGYFKIIWLSNILALSVHDEVYSRFVSCPFIILINGYNLCSICLFMGINK